jgi:hypothetical protein
MDCHGEGKISSMSDKPVVFASSDRIDAFKELPDRFVNDIFGLPWALMTDESALSDFRGCGLDDREDLSGYDDAAYAAYWDQWVVERICTRYRVESFPVSILLVQLFERIDRATSLQ